MASPKDLLFLVGGILSGTGSVSGPGDATGKQDYSVRIELSDDCDSDGYETFHQALATCGEDEAVCFRCPALSLHHNEHTLGECSSRRRIQSHVASLLARELNGELPRSSTDEEPALRAKAVSEVPRTLLENVSESFAVLVESRLRAYATHLASRALGTEEKDEAKSSSIQQAERKIEAMLQLGGKVSVDSLIRCRCEVEQESPQLMEEETDDDGDVVTLPLRLEFSMELSIPRSSQSSDAKDEKETLHISITAPGNISGKWLIVLEHRISVERTLQRSSCPGAPRRRKLIISNHSQLRATILSRSFSQANTRYPRAQ